MMCGRTLIVWAVIFALGLGSAFFSADASANPYLKISERNVFDLKEPPPPAPTEPPPPEPSKITLAGITTIFGPPQALMTTPPPAAKPGQPAQGAQSFRLGVGQREGDIEVLAIDINAGSVTVKNAGREETLTFDKNGPKLASSGAPPGPGAPGGSPVAGRTALPGGIPAPATTPGAPVNPFAPSAVPGMKQQLPTRSLRLPSGTGFPTPGVSGAAASPVYTPGYTTPATTTAAQMGQTAQSGQTAQAGQTAVPVSGLFSAPSSTKPQQNWPPERYDLSREEQAAILLLQRESMKNDPNSPPFPPIPGF